MAVYTQVTDDEAAALVQALGLGRLRALEGIRGGIENTNYFVSTEGGEWVLTLFERLPAEQLPYFLGLMQHLARAGLPVPSPQARADGQLVHRVAGKPAALVTRLPGHSLEQPGPHACAQLGSALAQMHLAAASFPQHHPHERGLAWWAQTLPQVLPHVPETVASLLRSELRHQQACAASVTHPHLPTGPIHADLFRDNVLFTQRPGEAAQLSGLFDFYFAGTDTWLFDLAVCLNDWCLADNGPALDAPRCQALLGGYQAVRPLLPVERTALPDALRAAALRFWISRLWDWYLPREASLLTPKNPEHFQHVLRDRIDNPRLPAF
jgi:homoserine kinase type II